MSADAGDFPGMEVKLRHEFGRWRLYVDGSQQDVSAKEALKLARTVAKVHRPGTHSRVIDHVGAVRERIRADADEAEAQAEKEQEYAMREVESRAASAHGARVRAIERRREADELAPKHEQPAPFVVGD